VTIYHNLNICLETKLHKLKIKWINDEELYVFLPIQKDDLHRWQGPSIKWTKTKKKATRKVVEMKCLAFRAGFETFDDGWYLSTIPWKLEVYENRPKVCYVGIGFYGSRDKKTIQTSLAQIYECHKVKKMALIEPL
jgi:hypothetical protein